MLEIILAFLKKFWQPIAAVGGVLLGVIGIYFKGKGDQKIKDRLRESDEAIKVQQKIIQIRKDDDENQKANRKIADDILSDPNSGFDK